MNLIPLWGSDDQSDEEMAGSAKRSADASVVAKHASALANAGAVQTRFDQALAALMSDERVLAAELISVAREYGGASHKLGSKKAALDAIRRRFVELVRFSAKNKLAAKAKPW